MCGQVCGDKVWRRAEEEKAEEPGIQNQKQEPHTKMWGKRLMQNLGSHKYVIRQDMHIVTHTHIADIFLHVEVPGSANT